MPDIYDAVLTGSNDATSDFIYTLKSFNSINYSGLTSHLSFQFPRQLDDIKAIEERPSGEIILRKNGAEVYRGSQDNYNFYQGSQNSTFSINGSYLKTEINPKQIMLPVELITNDSDGKRRFKIAGFHLFNPMDTLIYKSENIIIDQVLSNISADFNYMVLRES